MSQTLRGSIQSPGRGAEVVVTAVTAAVAVTTGKHGDMETEARSMTYKEAVVVGMDEQLAHLLVHGTIDEDRSR